MKKRLDYIDILKGVAIFLVIFVHCASKFLKYPLWNFLWDYSHFIVPVFVLSSSYLYFQKLSDFDFKYYFSFVGKRIARLIIPYYIYLVVLFLVQLALHKTQPIKYWLNSFILDINWLVLLFIQITLVIPLIIKIINKKISLLFFTITLLSSLALLFIKLPFNYKFVMWFPWLIFVFLGYYLSQLKDRQIIIISIINLLIFLVLRVYLFNNHRNLVLFNHKYPPNFYYVSYGIFFTGITFIMAKWLDQKNNWLKTSLSYLGKNSYPLFFIHFIFIFIFDHFKIFTKLPLLYFSSILISSLVVLPIIGFFTNESK